MPVTHWEDDYRRLAGVIVLQFLDETGQISVREAINAEIQDYLPEDYNILTGHAVWGCHVKITDFEISAVKTISGFPLSAKFGKITYVSLSTFLGGGYINHVFQGFEPQRCIVEPINYSDLPYSEVEISVVGEVASITNTTPVWAGGDNLIYGYNSFVGATGFYYDFAPTVIASISIPYLVRFLDVNPSASSGLNAVLNY